MGKTKQKYNWKARVVPETKIDRTEERKIKVDPKIADLGQNFDDSNPLVLPSEKRKTKSKLPSVAKTKFLSKKKRKELEKVVERKKKKENESSDESSTDDSLCEMEEFDAAKVKIEEVASPTNENGPITSNDRSEVILLETEETNMLPVDTTAPKVDGTEEISTPIDENQIKNDSSGETPAGNVSSQNEDVHWETVIVNVDKPRRKRRQSVKTRIKPEFEVTVIDSSPNLPNGNSEDLPKDKKTRSPSADEDPLNTDDKPAKYTWRKPATYVTVDRLKEIQESRLKLPILAEEQAIMETINDNQIVIIAGETGSGKTTQVPQFLYEAGYTKNGKIIGVTEPRRVAAISMSKRVGEELNLSSDKVSYLIRFEGNATPETEIKFMTDGVLLKEIKGDFLLSKYSVIILDEAHERSVYTDILMGLLSRIVPLRHKRSDPLKLIVMSATLRVEDFVQNKHLFKTPPPVIKAVRSFWTGREEPRDRTCGDLGQAVRSFGKVMRSFGTVNEELWDRFVKSFGQAVRSFRTGCEELSDPSRVVLGQAMWSFWTSSEEHQASYSVAPNDDTEVDLADDLAAEDEDNWDDDNAEMMHRNAQPMWVLPLYSILPSYKQAKVFAPPPEGTRLCIIATNVAETSLTIPGVKYVVDSGKVKTKLYDKLTGVSAFDVTWTSKAAANQRAGRAGRTGPGHCYRLYSSAVFNDDFEGWSMPEMQRRPVEDLVLQMKSLGIQRVVNFPFPSPPDLTQMRIAEEKLTLLGALQPATSGSSKGKNEFSGKLTRLGESMARFPVAPRFAKMLCLSHQHGLLEYTVAIVAAMSVQEVLLEAEKQGARVSRAKWAGQGNSLLLGDAMVLLRAVGAAEYANSQNELAEFCNENNIRQKAVIEVRKIRLQLTNEINLLNRELDLIVNPQMTPPDVTQ
ncbi:unnamed protein product, partial [Nesidiocoris tenuis]